MMMDNDFPNALGFLKSYSKSPIVEEVLIAGSPSFEIEKPGYGPAVTPEMFRLEMERLYPGYEQRRKMAVPNLMNKYGVVQGV